MLVLRAVASITFALAALACFGLAYASLPKPNGEFAKSPVFQWTDALSRCHEDAAACDPDGLVNQATSAPLSERPFLIRLGQSAERRPELAQYLLKRQPRSTLARLTLAERALSRGDQDAFLSLFLPLFQLDRGSVNDYVEVLVFLSEDEVFRSKIQGFLADKRPYWGRSYIARLSETIALPVSELIALSVNYPSAQPSLLSRLTRAGQWDAAYLAFLEFIDHRHADELSGPLSLTVPFNRALIEHAAPPPFNWRLHSKGAEFLHAGGVYVFYQGRRNKTFLSQTFPLSAGKHILEINQSGQANARSGYFNWRLVCAGSKTVIGALDITDMKITPQISSFEVNIPSSDCAYQTLTLSGVAGTFPQPARIEVKSVQVKPADRETEAP